MRGDLFFKQQQGRTAMEKVAFIGHRMGAHNLVSRCGEYVKTAKNAGYDVTLIHAGPLASKSSYDYRKIGFVVNPDPEDFKNHIKVVSYCDCCWYEEQARYVNPLIFNNKGLVIEFQEIPNELQSLLLVPDGAPATLFLEMLNYIAKK